MLAYSARQIVPSDEAEFPPTAGLRVEVGGDLTVVMASGETITLRAGDGETLEISVRRVLDTGTTADGIIGYW